ncbi:MAG: DNA-binding domain-containing protein, partial [Candidatus Dormibacteria bacterium]
GTRRPMSSLARIQGEFQDYLLRGSRAIEQHVTGSARVPVAVRLGVYGGGYGSRLIDALAANYPALALLLGEEDFQALGVEYVRTHDSPFFSIRNYGDELPEFLTRHPHYEEVPLLAELARWEWAVSCVFDAADAEPIGAQALAPLAPGEWARLRFGWHPSVRRLGLQWNAPQLWKALIEDAERPELRVLPEPVQWLAWRRDLKTHFRSLTEGEAAALDAARDGRSFGELCELLAAVHGEQQAAAQAAALLREWLSSGLIVAAVRA